MNLYWINEKVRSLRALKQFPVYCRMGVHVHFEKTTAAQKQGEGTASEMNLWACELLVEQVLRAVVLTLASLELAERFIKCIVMPHPRVLTQFVCGRVQNLHLWQVFRYCCCCWWSIFYTLRTTPWINMPKHLWILQMVTDNWAFESWLSYFFWFTLYSYMLG